MSNSSVLLSLIVWSPAAAALVAAFMPESTPDQRGRLRLMALAGAGFSLFVAVIALYSRITEGSAGGTLNGALVERHDWLEAFPITATYHLDADGISLPLLVLTTGVFVCAALAAWKVEERVRLHAVLLLLVEVSVNGVLSAQDYLLLLAFWGIQVLPLSLLLQRWGGGAHRRAAGRYLGVTLTAMALLATGVLLLVALGVRAGHPTFDIGELTGQNLESSSPGLAAAAFWLCLLSFALLMGAVPVHRWVVSAAAEATPAVASVLVGAVTTLGGYGMIRVLLGAFPQMSHRYSLLLAALAVVSAVWAAVGAAVQDDMRRVLGYAAVGQMALVLLATGTQKRLALDGAVLLLLARGLSYALLLLVAGSVEARGRTRSLARLGGLNWQAPKLGWIWLFAALAALGAPLLAGSTAEVLLFTGAFPAHRMVTVAVMATTVVTVGVLLVTVRRVFHGPPQEALARVGDATSLELTSFSPLIAGILFFGLLSRSVLPLIASGLTEIANRLQSSGGQ